MKLSIVDYYLNFFLLILKAKKDNSEDCLNVKNRGRNFLPIHLGQFSDDTNKDF